MVAQRVARPSLNIPRIPLENHTLGSFPERATTNASVTVVFFLRVRGAVCAFPLPLVRGLIPKATISVNYTDRGSIETSAFLRIEEGWRKGRGEREGCSFAKRNHGGQGPPRHSSDHWTDPHISSRLQPPGGFLRPQLQRTSPSCYRASILTSTPGSEDSGEGATIVIGTHLGYRADSMSYSTTPCQARPRSYIY